MVIKNENEGIYGGKERKLKVKERDWEKLKWSNEKRKKENIGENVELMWKFKNYKVV